jgi:hypothetical protein
MFDCAGDTHYHNYPKRKTMADTIDGVPVDTTVVAPEVAKAATDDLMSALNQQADQARRYYEKLAKQIKQVAINATSGTLSTEDTNMADIMTPTIPMMMGGGGGDGLFGGGAGGGGLIGGLILGSLLRNGGNLLGGEGGVAGAVLRNPPEQNQANMDLMAGIGQVDKSIAVSTATMEASQASQTSALISAVNGILVPISAGIGQVKDVVNANAVALMQGQAAINQNIMENRYELSKDISADGEKTRALITQQYEINLQRQLGEANAAIIELRSQNNLQGAAAGITLTNTNNINQMQQQSQQQQQYGQLANMIWGLGQSIRNDNSAINVGSGTQTSTPTNTNTNIR